MRRTTLAISLAALAGPVTAFAQTEVPEGSLGNETWTEQGSPYLVTGNVTIDTFTLEAGTDVLIATIDPNLVIQATNLTINGEPERPVLFEAETPADTYSWYGLIAVNATVDHLIMRHANIALTARGTVTNSVFEDNIWGLEVRGDSVVDRCIFENEGIGAFFGGAASGDVLVTNSLFVGHDLDGMACNGAACLISNCTFEGNRYGLYIAGQATVRNSIFSNSTWGIQDIRGYSQVSYSNFWQNTTDLDGNIEEGDGNIAVDPEYVDETDFHLTSTSSCIDAAGALDAPDHDLDGRPRPIEGDGEPDQDGSSYDMGAYEFDPDAVDGTGGVGAGGNGGNGGNGGQAGEFPEATGGGATSTGMGGAPVSDGGATQSSSESNTTTTGSLNSAGGAMGTSTTSPNSGEDASTTASQSAEGTPARLSKGCGCWVPGSPRSNAWAGLVLFLAVWLRRRA